MRLPELRPEWLTDGGRERMGIAMDCPRHPWGHDRARLWLDNPGDGGEPKAGACELVLALVEDEEHPFDRLTLVPASGYPPDSCVHIGHWRGWLSEGQLTESLIGGVGW